MSIKNPVDKEIYDIIINDMKTSQKNYSVLTNVEIAKMIDKSPITVRDKVIRLSKQGYLTNLINYWNENKKFFARMMLKGNQPG